MRGCREGGVPEAILQSRSYQQQMREHGERRFGNSSRRQRVAYRGFEIHSGVTSMRCRSGRVYEAGIRAPNGSWVAVAYDRTRPYVLAQAKRKIDRLLDGHANMDRDLSRRVSPFYRSEHRGVPYRVGYDHVKGRYWYVVGKHHVSGPKFRSQHAAESSVCRLIERREAMGLSADVSRFPPYVIQYRNAEGKARSFPAYDLSSARKLLRKAKRIDKHAALHGGE